MIEKTDLSYQQRLMAAVWMMGNRDTPEDSTAWIHDFKEVWTETCREDAVQVYFSVPFGEQNQLQKLEFAVWWAGNIENDIDKKQWWERFQSLWDEVAHEPMIQQYADAMGGGNTLPQKPEAQDEPVDAIFLDVIKKSYGWTLSVDGEVAGLTAGDHGFEGTGIYIPLQDIYLLTEKPTKEREQISYQKGIQAGIKKAIETIMEEAFSLTRTGHPEEARVLFMLVNSLEGKED